MTSAKKDRRRSMLLEEHVQRIKQLFGEGEIEELRRLLDQPIIPFEVPDIADSPDFKNGTFGRVEPENEAEVDKKQPERSTDYTDLKITTSQFEQALTISRKAGDREGEAEALSNLGTIYYQLGQFHKAI